MPRPMIQTEFKGIKNFNNCIEAYPNALVVGQLIRACRQQMMDAAVGTPEYKKWTMMALTKWVNDAFLGEDRGDDALFSYTLYQSVETEGSQASTGAPYFVVWEYLTAFARHLYDIGYDEQHDLPVYLYNPTTEEPFTFEEFLDMAKGKILRDGSPNPAYIPLQERVRNLSKIRVKDETEDTE